ncbi:MAG: hypothetical protein Q9166_005258 [cf. Caloplaca sp. 2 TL-2023]
MDYSPTGKFKTPDMALAAGFGSIYNFNTLDFHRGETPSILKLILVANAPQMVLSLLYFAYNGLFTSMLLADEWSRFAAERKGLRVTCPSSEQRSTYRLQLPYRYSIPLLTISAVLHWLVSQSLYVVIMKTYDYDGKFLREAIKSCGYSPRAILTTICVGAVVIIFGIANGFRRYKPGIPLVGSCSAAISAACHPPEGDDKPSSKAVQWGSCGSGATLGKTGDDPTLSLGEDAIGHCSLTSFDVEPPIEGALYAGLHRRKAILAVKVTS